LKTGLWLWAQSPLHTSASIFLRNTLEILDAREQVEEKTTGVLVLDEDDLTVKVVDDLTRIDELAMVDKEDGDLGKVPMVTNVNSRTMDVLMELVGWHEEGYDDTNHILDESGLEI